MQLPTEIDSITAAHVQALVDRQISEGKFLDYKQELPQPNDEFLKDITSFANTEGGHLIFGIREATDQANKNLGYPNADGHGILVENLDQLKLRLENAMRDKLAPRVVGVQFKQIDGFDRGSVIVAFVPQSVARPHSTRSQQTFHMRNSSGTYPLDIGQLRSQFLLSASIKEMARQFGLDRLLTIESEESPVPLGDQAKLVVHVLPLSTLALETSLTGTQMLAAMRTVLSLDSGIAYHFMNVDGLVLVAEDEVGPRGQAYVQVFRSGAVEAADTMILRPSQDGSRRIRRKSIEAKLSEFVCGVERFYSAVGIEPPIIVTITMLGVKGFTGIPYGSEALRPISKNTIRFPSVEISEFADNYSDVGTTLRPIFEVLAQSLGLNGSGSFDTDGRWHDPQ